MSRRAKQQQPAAGSRRTRRAAELPWPRPLAGLGESGPQIVSNPIFRREAGPSQPTRLPGEGDQHLRCVYGPGSLYALVHDDPAAAASTGIGIGIGKALPLPPCRAHPSARVGPAHGVGVGVGGPHGSVLRRAPHHDPFLAAYVACSKSKSADGDAAAANEVVDRPQQKEKQGNKKKATGKRCKEEGEVVFRGCGIWSGWAAGANKYAGAMSCRYGYGCAVAGHEGDAPAAAAKCEDDAPAGPPKLDLSWTPAVLSARALERREHR